jgi:adenine-specific DNA-methyltransferase
MPTDLRPAIQSALAAFAEKPLRTASLAFLRTLGYSSDRGLDLSDASPAAFRRFIRENAADQPFDETKALFADWASAHLLFQLTDEELSGHRSLFQATVQPGLLRSYVFFAIELTGDHYARGKLTAVARQLNRVFPMPVMVLIKHRADKKPVLSIAVINRRQNKRDAHKDVLGKVTIISDISLADSHRGHLDILQSFAFRNLVHPQRLPITSFDTLHAAWERIFNIELLNDRFYRELSSWYFWAMRHVHFPAGDLEADKSGLFQSEDKVREHDAKHLIRLLTRLLFVWFIKEKGLIPEEFFHPETVAEKFLDGFQPNSKETRFYKAILQNLFFATLNQTRGKREFRKDGQHQNTTNLLRHRRLLKDPAAFIDTVEAVVPFLNGGLFECLDHPHPTKTGSQGGKAIVYVDGFSDRDDNPLKVPDFLFFGSEQQIDLSEEFGDTKRKKETVRGLIHIFDSFKFTIIENTPIDQEIALDPELLGKVFENLLASYNPETKSTARKQTGSFYTPRPIVDYMVDESLKAHLARPLIDKAGMTEADARAGLDILFAYTDREHAFTPAEVAILIEAIDACNILDPACGSGAFPMGVLHKLVHILAKLDPNDRLWKERQLEKVDATIRAAAEIDDATIRDSTIADLEAQKADIEETFTRNELGYGRKLFLIENCLYGVDIQSIATQVSKLRFFISLVVDQTVDPARDNFGIRPLPNLETKFVTADTLIAIEKPGKQGELFELAKVSKLQKELKTVRHNLFSAKTPRTKDKYRQRDKELREAIAAELETNGWDSEVAAKLARWDPYNQNASADFFDPEWMFDRPDFDIVIGNPPYISVEKFARTKQQEVWRRTFKTFAARGDIYCFFYERSFSFLREDGILAFITSNKFQKAGYGKALRQLLTAQQIQILVDFCELPVFEASTDPIIVIASKATPAASHQISVLVVKDEIEFGSLSESVAARGSRYKPHQLKAEGWSLEGADGIDLVEKLRSKGTPLIRYVDERIYYGIKTGLNEAFVIDRDTRDRLIRADKKSADLIKPWIRGKDIKRWTHEFHDLYVIIVRFGFHSELSNYPAIRQHLVQFEEQLRARGQCRTSRGGTGEGQHHWLELDNNPSAAFIAAFDEPKIVFNETSKCLHAYIDTDGNAINKTGFIILTPEAPFTLTILNSTALDWLYRSTFPAWGDVWTTGRVQFRGNLMNQVPIPPANASDKAKLSKLAERAAKAATSGDTAALTVIEREIDEIVYRLFDLTTAEINQIETALATTRDSTAAEESV